ncbi:class I SAM-dependent methyltransferase [Mobilicoccus pelagius]|uniref:Putative methyltransferase n=1 Tax=Mobilicoccus pelagius NBRC 104925 TaxID=1089455 RepID=H5UQW3_9MICO|nr:class I SAM-dependent methyltransferase [Mobilicoccus pelagius]GAB48121.1 putative methyltransferase [Mobilicoccus pelagius NBRC 104925]
MTGKRISGEAVELDPSHVRSFFTNRETRLATDHPLTAVLYQDHDPTLAEARDRAEKDRLLCMIDAGPHDRVLDVACGVGRWATPLIDRGAAYRGIDFAEGLLAAARESEPRGVFDVADVSNLTEADVRERGAPTKVLVCGALIYLNDDVVRNLASALASGAAAACRVVLREPTALVERLTLDGIYSAEMQTEYSAIYRTADELLDLFGDAFVSRGFRLAAQDDLYEAALNNRAETRQRFYVWERTE